MAAQPPPPRSAHPYYMYDAIVQQPDAIARVLQDEAKTITSISEALHAAKDIHLVGIGTSWHGSLVGEVLFRQVAGRHDARAWNSFEFSSLPPTLSVDSIVIVISHRGTKQFSLKALQLAKGAGAKTVILTGLNSAAHTDLCDFVVRTSEQEKSSAFTISHTCTMTALLMMAISLGELRKESNAIDLRTALHTLPDQVRTVLDRELEIEELVKKLKDLSTHLFVGYGYNVSSAYEAALKIKEAAYTNCEGFQIEQYVHGPFVATDNKTGVVFLDPVPLGNNSLGNQRTTEIVNTALELGASVVTIAPEKKEISSEKYIPFVLPHNNEAFSPITYLVVLQLFTYKLALAHGRNPDVFRKDNKIYKDAFGKLKL